MLNQIVMLRSFAVVLTLIFIICFSRVKSSQYGGLFEPYHGTQPDNFNKSDEHGNKSSNSILMAVQTITEDSQVRVFMEDITVKQFVVSVMCFHGHDLVINVSSTENTEVLRIIGNASLTLKCEQNERNGTFVVQSLEMENETSSRDIGLTVIQQEINITLKSGMIGISSLLFKLTDLDISNTFQTNTSEKLNVYVVRYMTVIDIIFLITVYILEILEMLTFGTQLDLDVVKDTLKKPIQPLIGLMCQYLGMPLISFAIAKAVASDSLTAVGIFVAGVCPGGGSSNIYTYLLDGDLSLSITMTTISTLLSLAMLPLWLYTLGSVFLEENNLNIPYTDIVVTLSIILVPLTVGLFIRIKFPKVTGMIEKVMAVVLTILALILITTGVISSLYLFKMFNLKIIAVGCILPYVGFCLGAVISFIFKQPRKSIKTIAIETGMQNTAIAMILLLNSFPEPLGDIATVAPVSAEVMSPIPPFIASIVYLIWKSCCRKYEKVEQTEKNKEPVIQKQKEIGDREVQTKHVEKIVTA